MTSIDFMNPNEPNFYFKNINAALDMGLIIEKEIIEKSPKTRVEEIETLGRSGSLHEWHGDYEPYDLKIPEVSIPYDRLDEVKQWLRGSGKLVTHNDVDKYRTVRCNMTSPVEFENEWGYFYTFEINFRCQPFRKRLQESPIKLIKGINRVNNPGHEISQPTFLINATGGDFSIKIGNRELQVINAFPGQVEINTAFGKITQESSSVRKKGSWPLSIPGQHEIILSGAVDSGLVRLEAVYL